MTRPPALPITRRAFALGAAALAVPVGAARSVPALRTGLDRLVRGVGPSLSGKRIALLTHAGAVDATGRRGVDAIAALAPREFVALFSPEHGLGGTAAAGEHVDDARDAATGVPVFSLYGKRRRPPPELLARIDLLLIDLQDVGLRPFTYAATIIEVIEAAAAAGVEVLVLDRPNPLGGLAIEGPLPAPGLTWPSAALPVPFRHGLTIGELARLGSAHLPGAAKVLTMQGWHRSMTGEVFGAGRLPFIPPSPNLRTPRAIQAYGASVLIEGTNLSEGRGTPGPFETVGAPFVDGAALAQALTRLRLPGVAFAPVRFTPQSSKHAGTPCQGVSLEVRDPARFQPLLTGLHLLAQIRQRHPHDFAVLPGERPFLDLLTGQPWLREGLLSGANPQHLAARWRGDVARFKAMRRRFLLY